MDLLAEFDWVVAQLLLSNDLLAACSHAGIHALKDEVCHEVVILEDFVCSIDVLMAALLEQFNTLQLIVADILFDFGAILCKGVINWLFDDPLLNVDSHNAFIRLVENEIVNLLRRCNSSLPVYPWFEHLLELLGRLSKAFIGRILDCRPFLTI